MKNIIALFAFVLVFVSITTPVLPQSARADQEVTPILDVQMNPVPTNYGVPTTEPPPKDQEVTPILD